MRLVYAGLHLGVGNTASALREGLGLPERTVRHAVRWLVDEGLAERRPLLSDARQSLIVGVAQ